MIFTENNDCSAVYKTNVDLIGGFDRRFSMVKDMKRRHWCFI